MEFSHKDCSCLEVSRALLAALAGVCTEFFQTQTVTGPTAAFYHQVTAQKLAAQLSLSVCRIWITDPLVSTSADLFWQWALTLPTLYLWQQTALPTLCWVLRILAYLLMRGCWNDSKTRLQLSRHLFTPRMSTKKSEGEKTSKTTAALESKKSISQNSC